MPDRAGAVADGAGAGYSRVMLPAVGGAWCADPSQVQDDPWDGLPSLGEVSYVGRGLTSAGTAPPWCAEVRGAALRTRCRRSLRRVEIAAAA